MWDEEVEAVWRSRLEGAWACKAVAEDGRLAGFAWLKRSGEFDMLYVAPWAGRRGLGGRMLAELERQAEEAGVTALHAWASHASRPVFERAGYRLLRANRIVRGGVGMGMSPELVISIVQNALYILIIVSAPVLLTSLLVGLLVSVLQAATQINEMTLTFIPKLLAMFLVLVLAGPWMLNTLIEYTTRLFQSIPNVIG
ncbi:flagellar biosynthetic protein FliQ [Chromobacterium violaceum]|nr:flagellar biosynthetic protein FliQ [Chromobacterium violaceum]